MAFADSIGLALLYHLRAEQLAPRVPAADAVDRQDLGLLEALEVGERAGAEDAVEAALRVALADERELHDARDVPTRSLMDVYACGLGLRAPDAVDREAAPVLGVELLLEGLHERLPGLRADDAVLSQPCAVLLVEPLLTVEDERVALRLRG